DGAEVEPAGGGEGAADVLAENGSGQSVGYAVCHRDRVVVGGERLHGHDRAEDLALDDIVVLLDARDDRRLDEESAVAKRAAAGDDGRPGGQPLEEAENALALCLRDDGPHVDV